MLAGEFALLFSLLIVCCFSPGFFLVRQLRWTPMEKLCGSTGLSLILLYLTTWFIYLVGGSGTGVHLPVRSLVLISTLCAVLGIIARRDVSRLLHSFRIRSALLAYSFLLVWTLVLLGMIRVYSGEVGPPTGWNISSEHSFFYGGFLQTLCLLTRIRCPRALLS